MKNMTRWCKKSCVKCGDSKKLNEEMNSVNGRKEQCRNESEQQWKESTIK